MGLPGCDSCGGVARPREPDRLLVRHKPHTGCIEYGVDRVRRALICRLTR